MSDNELTEEDLAAGIRALADSAEHTAMETRAIGQRLGILPPDENPRPQTVGAALAAFDGSQRALQAALGELIEARDEAAALAARVEAQERDIDRLTAALSKAAQDAMALEDQLLAAQKDNTALIERIVDLEHQRDSARRWAAAWREGTARKRGECAYWKTEAMRRSRITDRYIEAMAARNNALATRIVDLERDRDRAMLVVACAAALVSRAEGLSAQMGGLVSDYITEVEVRALALALAPYRGGEAPLVAVAPGRLCDHCGLPLVSSHIADETVITDGTRRVSVHHVCASAYPGWTVVATARGGL